MTPTSEERREVAGRLRGLDIHDWYDYADEIDSLESAIECNVGQQFESQMWWHRLADLMDPTCHIEDDDWVSRQCMGPMLSCDRCGNAFPEINGPYQYCPCCGARVVSDDDQ